MASNATPDPAAHNLWTRIAVHAGLAALVWSVFGQTLRHDFINYDDPNYVYENPAITGGLSLRSTAWAFTHIHAQNWHPLTTLSHMLDCQVFGLAPAGHHFTNVLLHTLAVLLLFETLRALTGATWRSAFVSAIFAIHPLRVESVAWIAERKDVLSGVFFMLTLASYIAYARRPSLARYGVVFVMCALGLMSKPMLVTLPFVLLLIDYWPLQRLDFAHASASQRSGNTRVSPLRLIAEKLPLLCLSAGSAFATLFAQHEYIGVGEVLPLGARLTNAAISYLAYVRQMFWPVGLIPFYPHRENTVSAAEIVATVVVLAVITIVAIAFRRQKPYLAVGWLWFVGMLVPVIGIVQVGWQARADRYTYLPQIGLYIALTWLVSDLVLGWKLRRMWLSIVAGAVIAALASASFVQASYWRNSETIWTRTLAVTPENDVAENNLGIVLLARGRADEALAHYEAALKLRPDNVPAHTNVANVLIARGDLDAGMQHLRRALELDPSDADAGNLMGFVRLRLGDVRGAAEQWSKTLDAHPENGNAMSNLAWVYATSPDATNRNGPKAVELARRAFEISGGRNTLVMRTLAAAYAESGRFDDAIAMAQRALQRAEAEKNYGLAAELKATIQLYREHTPLRDESLAQRTE